MNEWLPVIAGYGSLIIIVIAARLLPRSWLREELGRWYGAKPHGAYSIMTRSDLSRRALLSVLAAVVLGVSSFALFPLGERFPNESKPRLIIEAYAFIAIIMAGMAALGGVLALLKAAVWSPREIRLNRERILDFATYLDLIRLGELPSEAWRDFSAVRFDDHVVDAIRVECVARIGPAPRDLSDADTNWLAECVGTLLARAA